MLKLKLVVAMILISGSFVTQAFAAMDGASDFQQDIQNTRSKIEALLAQKEAGQISDFQFDSRIQEERNGFLVLASACGSTLDLSQARLCAKELDDATVAIRHEMESGVISITEALTILDVLEYGKQSAEAGNGVERGKQL